MASGLAERLAGHGHQVLAAFQIGVVNFLQYIPAGGAYRRCSRSRA
jgi:hypothetical protein